MFGVLTPGNLLLSPPHTLHCASLSLCICALLCSACPPWVAFLPAHVTCGTLKLNRTLQWCSISLLCRL